jgi:hypothetical protein
MRDDLNYFSRRAAQERRAGMTAASEKARDCHFELAAAYEERVNKLQAKIDRPTLRISAA